MTPMLDNGTVFIVDDDRAVRESLECVLAAANLRTHGYATAEEFMEAFVPEAAGCLILDLRMPGMGGQELLETLRNRGVLIPVIIISAHADVPAVIQSMKLGLIDFLTKPVAPQVLLERVHQALEHGAALRHEQAQRAAARERLALLTDRETEVLRLLIQGRIHKEIARELGISARTVDHHHAQITAKTGTTSVADLVRIAMIAGLT